MHILHGENIVLSRNWLAEMIASAQEKQIDIERFETKKLHPAELESSIGTQSLFGNKTLYIIDELHSLPKSKRKTALIELLAQFQDQPIILWEKKSLTKPQLKKFPQANEKIAKLSPAIFDWLESLTSKSVQAQLQLFRKSVAQDSLEMCFYTLIRHLRTMIISKYGGELKGHPFYLRKISQQARQANEKKLLHLFTTTCELDYQLKTGKLRTSLQTAVEQAMLQYQLHK